MNKNTFHTVFRSLFSLQNCSKNTYKLNNSWFYPQTVLKEAGGRGKKWPVAPLFPSYSISTQMQLRMNPKIQLYQSAKGSESPSAVKIPEIQMGDLSLDSERSRIKQLYPTAPSQEIT